MELPGRDTGDVGIGDALGEGLDGGRGSNVGRRPTLSSLPGSMRAKPLPGLLGLREDGREENREPSRDDPGHDGG